MRVLRPVTATLGQLDDAALAHVRVSIGLRDVLPVALDVIQHQALAQREVAERDSLAFKRLRIVSSSTPPATMRSARRGSSPGSFIRSGMLRR
jgi:hypothetical protein